ncbi:MAG: hypothetical protein IPN89_09290 [Saprospiraceae bacterium]|nr:hypothetical protein [Saprospiraceae bacterium]
MGIYHFSDLAPGQYIVAIQTPSGYISAAADKGTNDALDSDLVNGVFPQVVLTSGQTLSNLDAGFLRYASVGDYVWIDTDGDGIQDAGEMGLPNINVSLTGTTGAGDQIQLNTTTTATGSVFIQSVVTGIYNIKVVAPSGITSKSDEGR